MGDKKQDVVEKLVGLTGTVALAVSQAPPTTAGVVAAALGVLFPAWWAERLSSRGGTFLEGVVADLQAQGAKIEALEDAALDRRREPLLRAAREAMLTVDPEHLERLRNAAVNMFQAADADEVWFGAYLDAVSRLKSMEVKMLKVFTDLRDNHRERLDHGAVTYELLWAAMLEVEPTLTRELFHTMVLRLASFGLLEDASAGMLGSSIPFIGRLGWNNFTSRFMALVTSRNPPQAPSP